MTAPYRIERVNLDPVTRAELDDLDAKCFPHDDLADKTQGAWWLVRHHRDGVIGFAGARYVEMDDALYLCRAGVLPEHRGRGLQRRLVRRRMQFARRAKCRLVYTYTASDNVFSANNLIRCGFELFEPNWRWGGERSLYFYKHTGVEK